MSAQKQVDDLFKDLDSFPKGIPTARSTTPGLGTGTSPADSSAIQALAELDDLAKTDTPAITAKPRLGGAAANISRPSSRATERVSLSSLKAKSAAEAQAASASASANPSPITPSPLRQPEPTSLPSSSSWGWGSVWNSASAAIQQAKTAVDEGVKNLPNVPVNIPKNIPNMSNMPSISNLPNMPNIPQTAAAAEQARQWREGLMGYVKNSNLEKIGEPHFLKTIIWFGANSDRHTNGLHNYPQVKILKLYHSPHSTIF